MRKSNMRLLLAALISLSATIGACNCGARLAVNGDTTVKIDAPMDGASFLISDTVTPIAHADNAAGLTSLAIEVGGQQLLLCPGSGAATTHIDCTQSFVPMDYASEIAAGKVVLTAVAISAAGIQATAAITLHITVPAPPDAGMDAGPPPPDAGPAVWSLSFVQPVPSPGFPPTATVSAPSPMQLAIVGTPPSAITSVVVVATGSNNTPIPVATFTMLPYSSTITWLTTPGVGFFTLTGTATAQTGETRTATVVITVNSPNCTSDASCLTGSRCCLDDGQCHPIVGMFADCDCAHPCPTDEGCFPGTCGQLPQQCRPGCFPGTDSKKADVCPPINGVQAYCAPLPPSQVTTQNKGGACAPGDGCSVTAQNCPDGPLNPGSDAGVDAGNPIVHWTCEPAAMNGNKEATVCYPSGTHPPQANNPQNDCLGEDSSCGSDTAGCEKGYECVGIEGDPAAGLACAQQCSSPFGGVGVCPSSGQGGCPAGQYCDTLIGNGGVTFTTGVCTALPQCCAPNPPACCSSFFGC